MKLIAIIGAFDRYNYGDLLFPIVIEEYLKKYKKDYIKECKLKYYGIVESDLTHYGGKKTEGIAQLFKDVNNNDDNIIIIAGGEVLPARWAWMYESVSENELILLVKKISKRLLGNSIYKKVIMKKLGVPNKFPWILSNEYFKKDCKIIYNSVGGATINHLKESELEYINEKLKRADYISVRDTQTKSNFLNGETNLVPDSVILLSEFFSNKRLESIMDEDTKNITDKKYICFQINLSSSKGKESIIARELKKIYDKYNYNILFLPIGIAPGHYDDIALKNIQETLNIPCEFVEQVDIYKVAYLIANSEMYIGTSLHGTITAMSYGKMHININKNILKTKYYNKTWALNEESQNIDYKDIFKQFEKVINLPKNRLEHNKENMIKLAHENFNKILEKIF